MMREEDIRGAVRKAVDEALGSPSRADAEASTDGRGGPDIVALGADHGGFALKRALVDLVGNDLGFGVRDCGTDGPSPAADYPTVAHKVARLVATGACRWGILVDGAGIGSAMAANKVPGVRAALCYDLSSARNSREHNLANVLTLGAGLIGEGLAKQIVRTWLDTPWGEGRHARRVALITDIEERYLRRNSR